jgi:hypothetical protein
VSLDGRSLDRGDSGSRLRFMPPRTQQVGCVKPRVTPTQNQRPLRPLTAAMAARFAPLILPTQLHDLPQDYNLRIKLYDAKGNISAQKHLDWFNDFVDLEEVDYEDVKMRLFTQSLAGDVRKWFKALPAGSILNFEAFETSFLAKWGDKKNPLQLLTQYNNMKRSPDETVQEFSARFMKVYNAIPDEVNPPPPPRLLNSNMLILSKVTLLYY